MLGVYLSIKTNSLTERNISLSTVFDLSTPLKEVKMLQDKLLIDGFSSACGLKKEKALDFIVSQYHCSLVWTTKKVLEKPWCLLW